MNRAKYPATAVTVVCCSMISETQTQYGSALSPGLARHGRSRRCASYQPSNAAGSGSFFFPFAEWAGRSLLARRTPERLRSTVTWMTERLRMDKPGRSFAKPLRDLLGKVVGDTFTRQGFASAELVTRWTEIAGAA